MFYVGGMMELLHAMLKPLGITYTPALSRSVRLFSACSSPSSQPAGMSPRRGDWSCAYEAVSGRAPHLHEELDPSSPLPPRRAEVNKCSVTHWFRIDKATR